MIIVQSKGLWKTFYSTLSCTKYMLGAHKYELDIEKMNIQIVQH